MPVTFLDHLRAPAMATTPNAKDLTTFEKFISKHAKDSVRLATAAALDANTRSGNVLTASANGALGNIDGTGSHTVGDRILVKNEAIGANNGIYTITTLGDASNPWTLTRATDWDEAADVAGGAHCLIQAGSANAGKLIRCTNTGAVTINTTAQTFGAAAGTEYTASTGLTLSGSDFQIASGTAGNGLSFTAGTLAVNLEGSAPSLQIASDELGIKFDGSGGLQKGTNGTGVKLDSNSALSLGAGGLSVATTIAGAGMTMTTGALNVIAGDTSMTVNANDLVVNPAASGGLTVSSGLKIADDGVTTARIVRDTALRVKVVNTASTTFAVDDLLHISGWNEANTGYVIEKADADAGKPAHLIATAAISAGDVTPQVSTATFRQTSAATLNTNAAAAVGDPVYLDTTAGGWTLTAPTGTTAIQQIVGRVAVKSATVGRIEFFLHPGALTYKIGTDQYQDLSVTSGKLAAGAVTAGKIATGGVSAAGQFAAGVVDSAALAASVAGAGLEGGGGSALAINLEDTTPTLKITSDELGVKFDSASFATGASGLALAAGVAGGGLGLASGVLSVAAGAGLNQDADGLSIPADGIKQSMLADTAATDSVIYSTTIGNGSATSIDVTHSFGKQWLLAMCYDVDSLEIEYPTIKATSTTVVNFNFAVAPLTNKKRVVLLAVA